MGAISLNAGHVVFFNGKKNLGMVASEDEEEFYFHREDLKQIITEGMNVTFEARESVVQGIGTDKRLFAKNIRRVNSEKRSDI